MTSTPSKATAGPLHPYCQKCGWRKGGVDSWDGAKCKCGEYAPPLKRIEAEITAISRAKGEA